MGWTVIYFDLVNLIIITVYIHLDKNNTCILVSWSLHYSLLLFQTVSTISLKNLYLIHFKDH